MIAIQCLEGSHAGETLEFSSRSVIIGRGSDCDVCVDDESCSREHARIVERDGGFFVEDLGSTNGVYLNGEKVSACRLSTRDQIVIGKCAFVFLTSIPDDESDLDDIISKTVVLRDVETRLLRSSATDGPATISKEELDELRKSHRQMQAIYSLNRAISGTLELEDLYELITDNTLSTFEAVERVCILMLDSATGSFHRVKSHPEIESVGLPVSRQVLERVRQTSAGILATDVRSDPRFEATETLLGVGVRSFMCVPLNSRDRTVGAVYVESRSRANCFAESDLELLTVFGNQMATAIEIASLYEELEQSFYDTVRSLSKALEAKDEYTRGHSDRVARYAVGIARVLGFTKERLKNLRIAAELHDIGKIAIPEEIINSPGRLSDEEFELIKKHPDFGVEILRPIRFLEPVLPIVRHHHERYNGKGYPEGWREEEIPLEARVLNLADAFDAMTTARSYNQPISFDDALARCRSEAGVSFDARCVDALCVHVEEAYGERVASTEEAERTS